MEWVLEAESNPRTSHAKLNPWHLQFKSCSGRCSAAALWMSCCLSGHLHKDVGWTQVPQNSAVGLQEKGLLVSKVRSRQSQGTDRLGIDDGIQQCSLGKITASFKTSSMSGSSWPQDVRHSAWGRKVLIIILGRSGFVVIIPPLNCWTPWGGRKRRKKEDAAVLNL